MKRFKSIDIETCSTCNRQCADCIRNTNPDREAVRDWFEVNWLPMATIRQILDQANAMVGSCQVCLSHYNEPLMDSRIVDIATMAKSYGKFRVYLVTNGDLLTPELASRLDGVLDCINVSLYLPPGGDRLTRKMWLRRLFKTTRVLVKGEHVRTHFVPKPEDLRFSACELGRLIINHRGQYLPCCEDMIGHFDMGRFPEVGLKEYWYGRKHRRILDAVRRGDRSGYEYCKTCPR